MRSANRGSERRLSRKYDEPRAREIFKDAFREIESLELSKSDAGKSVSKASDFARLYSLKYKLRSEVIREASS